MNLWWTESHSARIYLVSWGFYEKCSKRRSLPWSWSLPEYSARTPFAFLIYPFPRRTQVSFKHQARARSCESSCLWDILTCMCVSGWILISSLGTWRVVTRCCVLTGMRRGQRACAAFVAEPCHFFFLLSPLALLSSRTGGSLTHPFKADDRPVGVFYGENRAEPITGDQTRLSAPFPVCSSTADAPSWKI